MLGLYFWARTFTRQPVSILYILKKINILLLTYTYIYKHIYLFIYLYIFTTAPKYLASLSSPAAFTFAADLLNAYEYSNIGEYK